MSESDVRITLMSVRSALMRVRWKDMPVRRDESSTDGSPKFECCWLSGGTGAGCAAMGPLAKARHVKHAARETSLHWTEGPGVVSRVQACSGQAGTRLPMQRGRRQFAWHHRRLAEHRLIQRQEQVERCSAVRIVDCPHAAAMRVDDRPADGEAKAEAMLLRRDERLEHRLDRVAGDPGAAVGDAN